MKKRFPTLSHLCEAGIVTENEQKIIESVDEKCIQHPKYWMSLVWAGAIVTRAKKEGRIKDDFAFRTIIKEINKFRSGCGGLLDYDWISIPLVYTQVSCDWWTAGHVTTILTSDWSARIPTNQEKAPVEANFDQIVTMLKETTASCPVIFNCQAGISR